MIQPNQQRINISHSSDVIMARRTAKEMATAIGFDGIASEEITLVVKELASNLLKHAKKGTLTLTPLDNCVRVGIQIESENSGSEIMDTEQIFADGFSTIGSLGYGLGTVNRMMDEVNIASKSGVGSGNYIICQRWVRKRVRKASPCPLSFGAATRPHQKMAINGDAFVVKKWDESMLVALIDGLGHGQFAHNAAEKARQYVEIHFAQPLAEIFRGVDRSCRNTHGVVMALVRFDWFQEKLNFASIGNVGIRVFGAPEPIKFIIRRGILGINAPKALATEHRWEPTNIMVLYSDGLRTDWKFDDFSGLWEKSANEIAISLLRALAKSNDDATVVVVKGNAGI